jgi:hypothetical protein
MRRRHRAVLDYRAVMVTCLGVWRERKAYFASLMTMTMNDVVTRALMETKIQPIWHLVCAIRQQVGDALSEYSPELRTAAAITASELVENAIKYGDSVVAATTIHFSVVVCGTEIRMRVSNGTTNRSGVSELLARVAEIRETPDKEALYLRRLEQLMANPGENGKLGLYRMAFEGQFELAGTYEDDVVTMTATRRLA